MGAGQLYDSDLYNKPSSSLEKVRRRGYHPGYPVRRYRKRTPKLL